MLKYSSIPGLCQFFVVLKLYMFLLEKFVVNFLECQFSVHQVFLDPRCWLHLHILGHVRGNVLSSLQELFLYDYNIKSEVMMTRLCKKLPS